MSKPTVGTYFSGGGIGLARVKDRVDIAFGVEYDPAISEVYRANISDRIITARVQDVDVTKLESVDLFQVSPVCKEFSNAKVNGKESAEEMGQAAAICAYLDYHKPRYFVLENVRGYIRSKSFTMIVVKLSRLGYTMRYTVENSADYGVPQTRERLILRAALDCPLPSLPDYVGRWVGWYEAIEDLIPGLPGSKFADWQLARLPEEYSAFLMRSQNVNQEGGNQVRPVDWPAMTITANERPKAFLADGTGTTVRYAEEPTTTITAAFQNKTAMPRAFLADMFNASREFTVREEGEPSFTVTSTHMRRNSTVPKAFIISDQLANTGQGVNIRDRQEPSLTVDTRPASKVRAWLSQGRIVQMTPRALARFQSIPDWYELPQKNGLACCVIGNGVPSLMGQGIIGAMLGLGKESEEAAA